jgi:hypothetical protein
MLIDKIKKHTKLEKISFKLIYDSTLHGFRSTRF